MSQTKRVLLWLMSGFYIVAGAMHFITPDFYMPMMPPYLPWHLPLVYISGVAEFVLGALVLMPQTRQYAAWGIIALLIAVFPANLHIALHNVPLGGATEGYGIWNWLRLPLQGLLIAWAWWYTQPEPPYDEQGGQRTIVKLPMLRRLDDLSKNLHLLEPLLKSLKTDTQRSLVDIGIQHKCVEETNNEAGCLRQRWFDREQGWWKDLPAAEPVLRSGLIRAGELVLEHKLPLDCYWVLGADQIKVAICKSESQVTVLFLSPMPPGDASIARFQARGPDVWVFAEAAVQDRSLKIAAAPASAATRRTA
jgi:uncharacterized membrane protein